MENNKHKNGFNSPKDYFENFEDRLFSKLSEDMLPKDSGFKVPEGYFNQLEDTLVSKVIDSEKETKVISLFSRKTISYAAAIAACAIIAFSLFNTNNTIQDIDTITISSIETYIEEGNVSIDYTDLASLLEEEDFTNNSSESYLFSEESIEEYLLDNIDDSSILLEL